MAKLMGERTWERASVELLKGKRWAKPRGERRMGMKSGALMKGSRLETEMWERASVELLKGKRWAKPRGERRMGSKSGEWKRDSMRGWKKAGKRSALMMVEKLELW